MTDFDGTHAKISRIRLTRFELLAFSFQTHKLRNPAPLPAERCSNAFGLHFPQPRLDTLRTIKEGSKKISVVPEG